MAGPIFPPIYRGPLGPVEIAGAGEALLFAFNTMAVVILFWGFIQLSEDMARENAGR